MKIVSISLITGLLFSSVQCYALTIDNGARPVHPVNTQHAQNEDFDQACVTAPAAQQKIHFCITEEQHAQQYCEDEALRECKNNNPLGDIGPHHINNR